MNDIHLWLGIGSSVILFVVCLTGTIYTYKSEIQTWLAPSMYKIAEVGDTKVSLNKLQSDIEQQYNGVVSRVSISDNAIKPYVFSVSFADKDKRGETVYVNPYNGEVLGEGRGPASEFFMTVFKLHRWLLLDMKIGRPIVGVSTIIFIVLSISGMILWLPKKVKGWKSFRPGFQVKFKANWKRINHDLHNTLGFYTFAVLFVLSITGLCWSFEWYRDGLSKVLGTKVFGGRNEVKPLSNVVEDGRSIRLEDALALADKALPYQARTVTVTLPKNAEGSFEISKNELARFNETVTDRVFIDQYTGVVIRKELFSEKSIGEKLSASIRPLHFGDIYGGFSKFIYFIVCLIATSLPITGLFIWLNKMKKKSKK
ncbi:PepSY domain-containing protein [Myroides sp. BIT-d1]|uniref:PepSY domain-containing protein n=1 Tax=Myroides albus TaxID=2562892 RepID=A0A6I3LDH3_9FLAO|nr:PepSY domain-containing protein [Myroides albus]MVX35083.1 PepSY domain-containing protein [Myroides sp. LoEW2-1]